MQKFLNIGLFLICLFCEASGHGADFSAKSVNIEVSLVKPKKKQKTAAQASKKTTGHTPEKGKKRGFSIYSPMRDRYELKATSHLSGPPKKIRFHDDGSQEVVSNQDLDYIIIDSNLKEFIQPIAFVDPWNIASNVYLNGADASWKDLALQFIEEHNPQNAKDLLENSMVFVDAHISEFLAGAIYNENLDNGAVCRHYASVVLPFMQHVIANSDFLEKGQISQLTIATLDDKLEDADEPHVFNAIKLVEDDGESYWFVDYLNNEYARIDTSPIEAFRFKPKFKSIRKRTEKIDLDKETETAIWIESACDFYHLDPEVELPNRNALEILALKHSRHYTPPRTGKHLFTAKDTRLRKKK